MLDIHHHDIVYDEMREATERHAALRAIDLSAKVAHDTLASLYSDRIVIARQAASVSPKG